jgi:hypothetical protein
MVATARRYVRDHGLNLDARHCWPQAEPLEVSMSEQTNVLRRGLLERMGQHQRHPSRQAHCPENLHPGSFLHLASLLRFSEREASYISNGMVD